MAKVYIVRAPAVGKMPATWSLYRVGDGPGRCEGQGFHNVPQAKRFAEMWGHEVVTLKAKGARR